jgi:hypothetical protein
LAKTLRRHEEGLLAYYDYPLSTGPLEGTNNKIPALQRQAYGYRDREFFRLKLMALHEAKYVLSQRGLFDILTAQKTYLAIITIHDLNYCHFCVIIIR